MLCSDVLKETAVSYWQDEIRRNFPNNKNWASPYGLYLDCDYKLIGLKDLEQQLFTRQSFSSYSIEELDDPEEVLSNIYQVVNDDYLYDAIYAAVAEKFGERSVNRFVINAREISGLNREVRVNGDLDDLTNEMVHVIGSHGLNSEKISNLAGLNSLFANAVDLA